MSVTWLGIAAMGILAVFGWMGFRRGFIREVVTMFFWILSMVLVWFINPYVNEFLKENTGVYETVQNGCQEYVGSMLEGQLTADGQEQTSLIQSLGLPSFLKEGLEENNTASVYQYLAVNTFAEYIADYLATAAVNGLSFWLSLVLSTILIRTLTYALNIIARLPIIHGVNKSAGAVVGVVKGLLFIWIVLLVLTIFVNTEIGRQGLALVEQDAFMKRLYEQDIFVNIFMSIFYGKN